MGLFETCDSNEIKHLKSFHHVFFCLELNSKSHKT
uniref:Uncharacterized protein ANTI-RAF1 n=1 Tax=Seriola quinqueradiata TaxID=8161 RepID=Q76K97_SERQU|nr:Dna-J homologous hypothetical protein [Seriola quinqueradiata]